MYSAGEGDQRDDVRKYKLMQTLKDGVFRASEKN